MAMKRTGKPTFRQTALEGCGSHFHSATNEEREREREREREQVPVCVYLQIVCLMIVN